MTRAFRRVVLGVAAGTLTIALTGCSLNTIIWGADGANVISTSDQLISAASAGEGESFACAGVDPDLRSPSDWEGLAAGEPERFVADFWPGQVELDPAWSINLSLTGGDVESGTEFPADVFYREVEGSLCLVDVAWGTVE